MKYNKKEVIEYFESNLVENWSYDLIYNDWEGRWEIHPKKEVKK